MKENNLLFLAGVHGDENIGIDALKKLETDMKNKGIDWITANEKAVAKNTRFFEADLNRSAPGDKKSDIYEERRAAEIIDIAKDYKYMIDIHGATADSGIFTIVTNPKLENMMLAASLPVKNVVLWAAKSSRKNGPITQFVDCSVEIECGPKDSKKIQDELYQVLKSVVNEGISFDLEKIKSKNYYTVYGKLTKEELAKNSEKRYKDFEISSANGEEFFPLLEGQYQDIVCYKMKKVNFWELFEY